MDTYMTQCLIQVLNMGYRAGIAIVVVFMVRALFLWLHVPKKYHRLLWAFPFLRLALPVYPASVLSFFRGKVTPIPADIELMEHPAIQTDFPWVDKAVNQMLPPASIQSSINPMQVLLFVGAIVWVAGIMACLGYGAISMLRLKYRLRTSICYDGNVYLADPVPTAFVCGVFLPRIYLPAAMRGDEMEYVLAHERQHIKRKDHLAKIAMFVMASVYWFHPLVWIAYIFAGKDMESACDEAVVKEFCESQRKEYAAALLELSAGRKGIGIPPLAFAEGSLKRRVKQVLSYKKPNVLAVVVGITAIAALGIGLLTNPIEQPETAGSGEMPIGATEELPERLYAVAVDPASANGLGIAGRLSIDKAGA